jgi:hypothetical protein
MPGGCPSLAAQIRVPVKRLGCLRFDQRNELSLLDLLLLALAQVMLLAAALRRCCLPISCALAVLDPHHPKPVLQPDHGLCVPS